MENKTKVIITEDSYIIDEYKMLEEGYIDGYCNNVFGKIYAIVVIGNRIAQCDLGHLEVVNPSKKLAVKNITNETTEKPKVSVFTNFKKKAK